MRTFRLKVSSGDAYDAPTCCQVEISDERFARIKTYADTVKKLESDQAYALELFDNSPIWTMEDPEPGKEQSSVLEDQGQDHDRDGNEIMMECNTIVVTPSNFYYQAIIKHTDIYVQSWPISLATLEPEN